MNQNPRTVATEAAEAPGSQACAGPGEAGAPPPATCLSQHPFQGVPVAGLEAVATMRHRQISKFGHTPEADRAAPLAHLVEAAKPYIRALREDVDLNAPRETMIAHASAAAALLVALLDRLLAEQAEQEEAQ